MGREDIFRQPEPERTHQITGARPLHLCVSFKFGFHFFGGTKDSMPPAMRRAPPPTLLSPLILPSSIQLAPTQPGGEQAASPALSDWPSVPAKGEGPSRLSQSFPGLLTQLLQKEDFKVCVPMGATHIRFRCWGSQAKCPVSAWTVS